jgi:demethylmenaquinone methyltransferase / 2-methoxy-6-polyprenyl-1,4-benzoquinol methylase
MATHENRRDPAIQAMFDRIALRYDFLNRMISLRLDTRWRKRAIKEVMKRGNELILDVGAGTGDLTFAATQKIKNNGRIVGLDVSQQMLKLARSKQGRAPNGEKAYFVQGSALFAPFKDGVFDAVMTAFVLRNVSDLSLFSAHAFRVLKSGGRFVSLEMFPPSSNWFSGFYSLYFYRFMPWLGGVVAGDYHAYKYLAESVEHFYPPETISSLLEQAGFERITIRKFLNGAVCMHAAEKLDPSPHPS